MSKKGMIVVLSAPSGCGKDTVFKEISAIRDDVCESISATTRKPRDGEIDGVNYFFKTEDEFKEMIETNSFLEFASYNNCYYGTPADAAMNAVNDGKICFLIIERKGAQKVMKNCPEAVTIFLMPPDMETLKNRLIKRNTETEQAILERLEIAKEEVKSAASFDYVVVNNVLEDAVNEVNAILNKELKIRN